MMKSTALLGVQAYLAGLTFALAASPCSTPVLATLLGYVAASRVNNVLSLSLTQSHLPFLSHCFLSHTDADQQVMLISTYLPGSKSSV